MAQARGRPTAREWLERKSQIEFLYLKQNLTLAEVREFFLKQSFEATVRQYKTKLKTWGFDTKKIKGEVWRAMYVVLIARRRMNLNSTFLVPVRGGEMVDIKGDKITKQMRRASRPTELTLDEAWRILRRERVRLVEEDPQASMTPRMSETNLVKCTGRHLQYPSTPAERGSVSTYPSPIRTDTDSQSSLGSRLTPVTTQAPSSSGSLAFSPGSGQLPSLGQLCQRPMRLILGYTRPTLQLHPLQRQSNTANTLPSSCQSSDSEDFDVISALNALSLEPSCDSSLRHGLQKYIGRFRNPSISAPLDEEKKLAAEWAAHYVLRSLPDRAQAPTDQDGRAAAMTAFRLMVHKHNRFIFPYCNWMITVLGSNDQSALLTEFLQDCSKVIDRDAVGQELYYGSPFHFALALCNNNKADIEFYGGKFSASNHVIGMLWGKDSPNYLVNQYHYAWHKLEQKQYDQVLQTAQECLPNSERIMGPQDPVTINCLAILSRTHAEMGNTSYAITCLQDALNRLSNATEILQPYRHRLLRRLAMLQIQLGDLTAAESNLRTVMKFRLSHFGIDSEPTWNAINPLAGLLSSQGRRDESKALLAEMHERFDKEKQEAFLEYYHVQAPWVCRTCNKPRDSTRCCSASAAGPSRM